MRFGWGYRSLLALVSGVTLATALSAADVEPAHFRGQVLSTDNDKLVLKTRTGRVVELSFPTAAKVYSLARASFDEISLGTYVGSVAIRPDPATHKPIRSLSLLHVAVELRILDEPLRGTALGERKWDLRPDTIAAHGWVDDIEHGVLSIKYGPTDADETDVKVPPEVPIRRMSAADRAQVKRGDAVFAAARQDNGGRRVVEYLIVGTDGIVPGL